MLKLSSSLKNIKIISLRAGGPVGLATDPIVNPHNLKIVGWWCRVPGHNELQVVLEADIREHGPNGMSINDESEISSPEELVRHQEILEINFSIIGKNVKTKNRKLGKVVDYSYNDGMYVQKLYVEKPLHRVFATEDVVLIDRTQIIEVSDSYILVKDGEIRADETEKVHGIATEPA